MEAFPRDLISIRNFCAEHLSLGLPYPGSPKKEIQKLELDKEFKRGHDYTYLYPAMCRSIQSAGRVIRNPSKRGLVCLMGARFIKPEYAEAMPVDWFENDVNDLCQKGIISDVTDFWANH